MGTAACVFISAAGLIHVYVFVMESLLWGKAPANRVFRVSPEIAEHNRLFAFNQGFYNLFLAVAAFAGVVLFCAPIGVFGSASIVGMTLMAYSGVSMAGAGLVLLYSEPKLFRAALIQSGPPLAGLILLLLDRM